MRIRRHAARILSALSTAAARSYADAAAPAAAGKAADARPPQSCICELNQSPWDVMALSPTESGASRHFQETAEEREGNCFAWGATWTGQGDDGPAAAAADVSCSTGSGDQLGLRRQVEDNKTAEGAEEEKDIREKKIAPIRKRGAARTGKRKTSSSYRAMEEAEEDAAKLETPSTCKKTDGKGWRCKRESRPPYSFCEYHLSHVRSYYSNGGGGGGAGHIPQQQPLPTAADRDAKQGAASIPDKRKTGIKKKAAKKKVRRDGNEAVGGRRQEPSSDLFYYYSGFGPWRGKRRGSDGGGGSDRGARQMDNVDDATNGRDDADGSSSGGARVHDQAPDDLDDDDDGADVGEDDVAAGRRGRKPVKARSLKSLL